MTVSMNSQENVPYLIFKFVCLWFVFFFEQNINSTHCRICMKELHSPSGYDAVNIELVAIGKSEILALILINN